MKTLVHGVDFVSNFGHRVIRAEFKRYFRIPLATEEQIFFHGIWLSFIKIVALVLLVLVVSLGNALPGTHTGPIQPPGGRQDMALSCRF